ncbi:transferrin-binding protein-like solute binding protein [Brevirhabdus sp.]|uniref:transferrin-binding protein-like solute binding protein n=1 Tax=Brevirhabdus sp. TaxID=2004514 RepID=UPI004059F5B9
MKRYLKFLPLAAVGLVAACNGNNRVAGLPFMPTQATPTLNQVNQALDTSGKSLQGMTVAVQEKFGSNGPNTLKSLDPSTFEIERTATGYTIKVAGESYTFTDAQVNGGAYEVKMKNTAGQDRTLAFFFSEQDDTARELKTNNTALVPLFYGIRTNSQGTATANNSDGFITGASLVGLETAPSAMPKTGKATYNGRTRFEFRNRSADYSTGAANQQVRLRYRGGATITADFGAGTVSGNAKLEEKREGFTKTQATTTNIATRGAAVTFTGAKISDNGFSPDLVTNTAADTQFSADGINLSDFKGKSYGRFYGNAAQQVGVLTTGESSTHTLTGTITGTR